MFGSQLNISSIMFVYSYIRFVCFLKKRLLFFQGFFFNKLSKPKNQQGVKKCLHVKIFSIVGQVMAPWLTSIELGILHIVTSYSLSPVEALDNIEFLKKS